MKSSKPLKGVVHVYEIKKKKELKPGILKLK